ncbi:inactive dipeptidyl peptidase 10-like isoform X2 [Penaeus chinensis]|uniref:inactive dipeptidyl peptidase 10-like isoform X2 n=1 Tax=Penaeus chinensis TaxID=139456 RepID=UPI001FB633DA|nr:inactive dipeptidyl peptidase 10-like isoform X2 [Penaeus chinensis]
MTSRCFRRCEMITNSMEQNDWKVPPDNTVQVVDPMGMNEEADGPKRNWTGILISLGIITFVLLMVTIATLLVGEPPPTFYGRRLVITDLKNPAFVADTMGTQWVTGEQLAYVSEKKGIRLLNVNTNVNITLVTNIALHQTGAAEFSVSPNMRYVLLVHDVIKGRLFTSTAEYSVYDVTTDHYYPLKLWRQEVGHPRYQHAAWVGESGAALVVVNEANIFYLTAPNASPVKLTSDATPDILYNGVPDLLYEEILGQGHAVWPCPSGDYVAAVSINNTGVRELPVLVYADNVYPTVQTLRYPTVSTPIPEAWLWIYDLQSKQVPPPRTRLIPPEPIEDSHYIVGVGWVNSTAVWVSWASRDQSSAVLATCEAPSWNCSLVHVNHKDGGVSPVVRSVIWAGSWAVFPWSVRTLSGSWHNHVALVGAREGRHAPLTLEDYHVVEVLGYDTSDDLVFFRGSELVNGAGRQQVYSVSTMNENVACLTCHLGCPFVTASLSPTFIGLAVSCTGSDPPSSHLVSLVTNGSSVTLHSQVGLRIALEDLALPVVTSHDVALAPALHAAVTLTLPPGWSAEDDTLLYPLVVQMKGPGEQNVDEGPWHLGWKEYLASGHQVAHASVQLWGADPSTRASTHTLAQYQARVIQKMMEQFDFLDPQNVAVWGWGPGASLALDAAALAPDLLKCVAAVNPVTDWRAHGSFWAERLLGAEDSEGAGRRYEDSDLTRLAPDLGSNRVLLAHGTRDPAAHHAFLLAHSFIAEGSYFTHVVYTDDDYMLDLNRYHLINAFKSFFFSCLHDPLVYEQENE